jgi:hypothetical protein
MGNLFICELALIMDMMISRLAPPTTATVAAAPAASMLAATTTEAGTSSLREAPGHSTVVIAAESARTHAALAPRFRVAARGSIPPTKGIGRGAAAVGPAFRALPGGTAASATVAETAPRGIG